MTTLCSGVRVLPPPAPSVAAPPPPPPPAPPPRPPDPPPPPHRRREAGGRGRRPPRAAGSAVRDGQQIGNGTVPADGTVTGNFTSGALDPGLADKSFDLTVTDGSNQAATRFRVSRFVAEFAPARGNPATLRVRFSVFGFGRPGLPIYVHYLAPGGLTSRTLLLGRTRGVCGSITRTRIRRLFPFRPAPGRWRLQFDNRRSYRKASVPRIVRAVDVKRHRKR